MDVTGADLRGSNAQLSRTAEASEAGLLFALTCTSAKTCSPGSRYSGSQQLSTTLFQEDPTVSRTDAVLMFASRLS